MNPAQYRKILRLITAAVGEQAGCSDLDPKFDNELDRRLAAYLDSDDKEPPHTLVRLVAYGVA